MTRAVFSKVMWVGKATTFCVGLAVVFGIGTAALAAVPGDPFKLGRLNTVDRLTTLAGSVGGPLFKVDNNGSGPALSLETEPGNPPLKVNAEAGKAANLDADKLDGRNASAFLAADGKAADAAHADRADTAATADSAAVAGNANTLDGLDSSQFMDAASYSIFRPTPDTDSVSPKTVVVECPGGDMALGGHAEIVAPTNQQVPVALQSVGTPGLRFWKAKAVEMAPYDGSWGISASVRCVPDPTTSNEARESVAQSDLRNATAAATACSTENNGSYENCGSVAQLQAYGYSQNSNVTLQITTATVTRWVAMTQHNDGGSAYQFDTATGEIEPVPRFQ